METHIEERPVEVTLRYALTPEALRARIEETGQDPAAVGGSVRVKVTLTEGDLTPEDRGLLLDAARVYLSQPAISDRWLDDPRDVARLILEAESQLAAQREAKEAARREAWRSKILADPLSLVDTSVPSGAMLRHVDAELAEDPAVAEAIVTAEAEVERLRAEREQAEAAEAAEREAWQAAYEAERAAWIEGHGSERLRRLAAEGIELDAVYRDERLADERPAWQWAKTSAAARKEPRNAPMQALDLLEAARADEPEATLAYLDTRRWVPHDEDPVADPDLGPDECPRCDEDGEHQIGRAEYRVYATYLGRDICTREAVGA